MPGQIIHPVEQSCIQNELFGSEQPKGIGLPLSLGEFMQHFYQPPDGGNDLYAR